MGEAAMLLAEGFGTEKMGTTPGDADGPQLDSWNELCFWVCQPDGAEEDCCC